MKLIDYIIRQPARVAFSRSASTSDTVNTVALDSTRDADSVTITAEDGSFVVIPGATETTAGALTAADKAALAGAGGAIHYESTSAVAAASVPAERSFVRTAGYAAPGDGGGAFYKRVASAPAHDLRLQSADGAWWEIVPDPWGINILECGATGDGVADDTAAFLAWSSFVIHALGDGTTGPDALVTLNLAPGRHYTYTNNEFVYGIPRLRINANGARMECTSSAAFGIDTNAFNFQAWFADNGFADRVNPEPRDFGHLMADSPAGQAVVNLVTAADAAEYAAGDTVLVGGFANQDGGMPPDYRFFEYREVASSDATAGTVTLTEPLVHGYRADWPKLYQDTFTSEWMGPPRILKLHRSGRFLTRYFELNDAVLTLNRNTPANSRWNVAGVLRAVGNRVDASGLVETVISSGQTVELNGCKLGDVEGDKLVERCVLSDCEAGRINNFVGTDSLVLNRPRVTGEDVKAAPRNLVYNDPVFDNALRPSGTEILLPNVNDQRLVESAIFNNPRVLVNRELPLYSSRNALFASHTVSALGTSNEILIPKTSAWSDYNHIYPGALMVSADGAALAEVLGITEYDADNFAIEVQWLTAVPALPLELHTSLIRNLRVVGGNAPVLWQREHDEIRYTFDSRKDEDWNTSPVDPARLYGHMDKIRVHVMKAYTGADNKPQLRFYVPSLSRVPLDIDLSQVGYREVDENGMRGAATGDSHDPADWGFTPEIQLLPRGNGSTGLGGMADELPIVTVEVIATALV